MAKSNRMTESKFKATKKLLSAGISVKEVAECVQISDWTVYQIRRADTFDEYKNIISARTITNKQLDAIKSKNLEVHSDNEEKEENPTQTTESRQTIVVQASHYMLEEQKKTNELLTLISNKLAVIISDLYGVKDNDANPF